MKIQTEAHGNVHVIVPHGPLVRDDVDDFRRTVETAMVGQGMRVVLDLADVPYVDSIGIETLSELCDVSLSVHVRPKLAGLTDTCREALELTNVLGRVEAFDTVDNALRSCQR
jgi:anti-anti-sigma factor